MPESLKSWIRCWQNMQNNFQSPGDIAFFLFSMPVYFYGIVLAIAVFAGFVTIYYLFKNLYINEDYSKILDNFPYIIIAGIFGARLYYCMVNFHYYINHPFEILNVRQGGLSIHGMIIAGIIVLYIFAKKYKLKFLNLTDVFLCACSISQSIGRWGNFFNSEAFGYPTDLPWKLYISVSHRPVHYINFEYFHPTFLYESILDLVMFVVLFLILRFKYKSGFATAVYLIMYSLIRIFVEYFRIDSALYIANIPIAQIISVAMFFIGVGLFCYLKKQ